MANTLDVNVDVAVKGADDLKKVGDGFSDAEKKAGTFGSVGQGALIGVASAVTSFGIGLAQAGISAAIDAIGDSISLSSDKAEAASKAQVLFGDSYQLVADKAENAAETVGVSGGKYLELAGNVGNLVTNFGFAGDEAANMSTDIVQLAADVGSFNNAPTEDVVNAIGAAFRGETEPIRAFGVMLDDATVKAKAMELGLYDGVGALDKNAKATATYQLILEGTTKAQGDFARTSDGLANGQKIAAAKIEDALTKVGDILLPLAADLVPLFADALSGAIDMVVQVADVIGDWIHQLQPLWDVLSDVAEVVLDLYRDYLANLFRVLGDVADAISGPLNAALGIAKGLFDAIVLAASFLTDALGNVGNGLNNLHRFFDPNFAALDDLHNKFRETGAQAGLSGDQIETAWGEAMTAAQTGSADAALSMDDFVAKWKTSADAIELENVGDEVKAQMTTASLSTADMVRQTVESAVDAANAWSDMADGASHAGETIDDTAVVVSDGWRKVAEATLARDWIELGRTPVDEIAQGLTAETHVVLDAADRLVDLLKNGLTPEAQALKLIGGKYTKAVADGITSEIPGAKDAAISVALAAINTIEDAGLTGAKGARGMEAIGKYYDSLLMAGLSSAEARLALTGAGVASDVIDGLEGKYPQFTNAGDTAADKVRDGLDSNPWATWGASIGQAWVDGLTGKIAANKLAIGRAAANATRAMAGESPPKEGPLRNIDRWGENIADAWIGGMAKGVVNGKGVLSGAIARVAPGGTLSGTLAGAVPSGSSGGPAGAPIVVNVYAGVGDPVEIGRVVAKSLAAYQRASGNEASSIRPLVS